jgi:class 3 adenylate cyclase
MTPTLRATLLAMDESPFDGPLARVVVSFRTVADARRAFEAAGVLYALAAAAAVPFAIVWHRGDGVHPIGVVFMATVAVLGAVFFGGLVPRMSDRALQAVAPFAAIGGNTGAILVTAAAVYFVGPRAGYVAVFFGPTALYLFMFFRRGFAIASCFLLLGSYAVALAALSDPFFPAFQWTTIAAMVIGTAVVVGGMAARLDDLNHNLEQRVAEQVDELERTGRLRRFLSPQVADVVTAEGSEGLLAPHRADIAVFFVDLRGFTAFTNAVSADRVMRVLNEYYDVVASLLEQHGATIGGFDGDGVFAYLGDPVAHDDAAAAALVMAQDIATQLDRLTRAWSDAEAAIGFGIGLAYGEATLGVVGTASRADYTPVGAVVNLAARLCAEAKPGEIVIDDSMRKAAGVEDRVVPRPDVELKGFGATETFALRR